MSHLTRYAALGAKPLSLGLERARFYAGLPVFVWNGIAKKVPAVDLVFGALFLRVIYGWLFMIAQFQLRLPVVELYRYVSLAICDWFLVVGVLLYFTRRRLSQKGR